MKDWEIIADNLSRAGFSWGYVSAIDSTGRTIWIVDAYRDDGKRFVVHAEEKLTAFLELESPLIRPRRNAGREPYIFPLTEFWDCWHVCSRAKSVGRLPESST